MSTSIPISGLNDFQQISGVDFIPLVDSSSLTTYRSSVNELNGWMSISGSVLSASQASSSISASYAPEKATTLFTGSIYQITSSWSKNSLTASSLFNIIYVATSSWTITSSFSQKSELSNTASYVNFLLPGNTPLIASSSISSSWASQSLNSFSAATSSYAITSSFARTASFSIMAQSASKVSSDANPGIAKAFVSFWIWASPATVGVGSWLSPVKLSSFNVASVVYDGNFLVNPNAGGNPAFYFKAFAGEQFRINFTTPMPNATYCVVCSGGGEEATENITWTVYPFQMDVNGFYVTRTGGTADNNNPYVEHNWCQLVVYQL